MPGATRFGRGLRQGVLDQGRNWHHHRAARRRIPFRDARTLMSETERDHGMKKYLSAAVAALALGGSASAVANCRNWQPTGKIISVSPGVDLQTTINKAVAGTIIQLARGTYTLNSPIEMRSGVSIHGLSGAIVSFNGNGNYNAFHVARGVSDLSIWGVTFDGRSTGTEGSSPNIKGAIFIDHGGSINVVGNTFQNIFNCSGLFMYDSDNVYVQNNSFNNVVQGISTQYDDGLKTHHTYWVSDNKLNSFHRMGIEIFAGWCQDFHVDRNTLTWSSRAIGLSIVTGGGQSVQDTSTANGTIMGNTENGAAGSGAWGLELGVPNFNVEGNTMTNLGTPFCISSSPKSVIFNNHVSNATAIFSRDGGYESNFWVGSNTLNKLTVVGWPGHGLTNQPSTNYSPSIPACSAQ